MAAQPSRISRLLALVPYFAARSGISIDQAAADLGVTPRQLTKDLDQLFVCGLPGYYPDDLIDLEYTEGVVNIRFSAGMDRPLRLTTTEASTLLVALQALVDTPGAVDRDASRRAIAKIEQAVGESVPAHRATDDAVDDEAVITHAALRDAVRSRRAVRIRYYSATGDTVSERIVDPIRLQVMDNNTYLEAWCRSSEGVRLFRFDRVEEATVLDEPSAPPQQAAESSQSVVLADNPDLPSVLIEIEPSQLWALDYFMIEPVEPLDARTDLESAVRARLVYGSVEWLTRFLLGFGGRIRVIDDADVSRHVTDAALAARRRYA